MRIFAMGDIHGCIEPFKRRIEQLEGLGFFDKGSPHSGDLLILLGDYIDRGPDSLSVVQEVMELEHRAPGRVVSLIGNHEAEFLYWVGADDLYESALGIGGNHPDPSFDSDPDFGFGFDFDDGYGLIDEGFLDDVDFGFDEPGSFGDGVDAGFDLDSRLIACRQSDRGFATIRSFLGSKRAARFERDMRDPEAMLDAFSEACEYIQHEHADVIEWMKRLRDWYETDSQIFVHAGVEEAAGSEWRFGTSRETLLGTRRIAKGPFIKDVIAGHTGTAFISGDDDYHDVYWDGASHFYIDGTTVVSGSIPVLVFNDGSGAYSSLQEDGSFHRVS